MLHQACSNNGQHGFGLASVPPVIIGYCKNNRKRESIGLTLSNSIRKFFLNNFNVRSCKFFPRHIFDISRHLTTNQTYYAISEGWPFTDEFFQYLMSKKSLSLK